MLRLNDSYAVQLADNIRRTYAMNYQTGKLEDNRKWALFHNLADLHLVERVICSSTKKGLMIFRFKSIKLEMNYVNIMSN